MKGEQAVVNPLRRVRKDYYCQLCGTLIPKGTRGHRGGATVCTCELCGKAMNYCWKHSLCDRTGHVIESEFWKVRREIKKDSLTDGLLMKLKHGLKVEW